MPGASDCQGKVPRTCNANGVWVPGSACPFVCSGGTCTGVCAPGTKQCDGNNVQLCTAQGQWQNDQPCTYVCSGGACAGSCTPGTKQCSGTNVQTCQGNGTWLTTEPCQYVCASSACTGVCSPGAKQCSGTSVQTCDGNGQWQSTQTCPYVCSLGVCAGSCVPGTNRCSGTALQFCDSSGAWQNLQSCPYACLNNACTDCQPGAVGCNGLVAQQCSATTGKWVNVQTCPYVCSGGACIGSCTPGATQCVSSNLQLCDGAGAWQDSQTCPFACQNGACTGICVPGTKQCSGTLSQTCTVQGQWSSVQCPAVPGATTSCTGQGVCGYACLAGNENCNGQDADGCEASLATDGTNCGACGHDCGGGACVAGKCQPVTLVSGLDYPKAIAVGASDVYVANGVATLATNHSIVRVAKGGGAAVTVYPGVTAYAVMTDGPTLYWTADSGTQYYARLDRGPVSGGATENLVASIYGPNGLAQSTTDVFYSWNQPGNVRIYKRSKTSTGLTTLANVTGTPMQIIWMDVSDGYVWWTGGVDYHIHKTPTAGGATVNHTTFAAKTYAIATDPGYVYWVANAFNIYKAGIWRSPKTGNTTPVVVLQDDGVSSNWLLVDGTHAYVQSSLSPTNISRVPIAGGAKEIMFETNSSVGAVTQDAKFVYWTYWLPAPQGAVMRLAK